MSNKNKTKNNTKLTDSGNKDGSILCVEIDNDVLLPSKFYFILYTSISKCISYSYV